MYGQRVLTKPREVFVVDIVFNLHTETVGQAYPVDPLCVAPSTTVEEVLRQLKEHKDGSVLVCRDGRLVGIFTERDILRIMAKGGDLRTTVDRVMVPNPVTLDADDTVAVAIKRMSEGGYRRLPVVDGARRPIGLLKVSGIVRYLVEHFPKSVYNLPPAPSAVAQQREGP